jgi:xanthine/CO dehydrogenase XdhC/CoxF family maturation factor
MGHDWEIDQTLLLGIMEMMDNSEWNTTVGTIGSKAKWNSFSAAAKEIGISDSTLNQVLCPIGVEISAESPEEIAIAVCAQIIDERARVLRGEEKIKHSGWRSTQTE